MSWSAGCRAGWAGGSLADAIRLAGQVAAVERFAMIVGWRRASVYDPATETNQSLRAPGGRAGSKKRIRVCVPLAGAQARKNESEFACPWRARRLEKTNQSLRAPGGR